MRFGAFLRGALAPRAESGAIRRIKDWASRCLEASPETAFAVNEIACTDPSCPGIETVILVMEPGRKTRAYKIQKAAEDVTEHDLRNALGD